MRTQLLLNSADVGGNGGGCSGAPRYPNRRWFQVQGGEIKEVHHQQDYKGDGQVHLAVMCEKNITSCSHMLLVNVVWQLYCYKTWSTKMFRLPHPLLRWIATTASILLFKYDTEDTSVQSMAVSPSLCRRRATPLRPRTARLRWPGLRLFDCWHVPAVTVTFVVIFYHAQAQASTCRLVFIKSSVFLSTHMCLST